MRRGEDLEQLHEALPKNLICSLPVQDPKGEGFRRPALPFIGAPRCSGWRRLRSPVHPGARDGEGYGGGVVARRGKTLARLDVFSGGCRWVIYIGKSNQPHVALAI
jgi:hypothetical protein